MNPEHEITHSITLKFTKAQYEYIASLAKNMTELAGMNVAHSTAIMKLLEAGAPVVSQTISLQLAGRSTPKRSKLKLVK